MTPTNQNPTTNNQWNKTLNDRRNLLAGAQRYALTPDCNPLTGKPNLSTAQMRSQILNVPITATVAGDNLLIPTRAGKKLVYEVVIWNASAADVDLAFYQGPSATGVLLLPMSGFPSKTGLTLGFNGSFEMPHFAIDNGQAFVLNLSTTGPVQGMVRYRIQNGTQ